jgi:hypothetical protein
LWFDPSAIIPGTTARNVVTTNKVRSVKRQVNQRRIAKSWPENIAYMLFHPHDDLWLEPMIDHNVVLIATDGKGRWINVPVENRVVDNVNREGVQDAETVVGRKCSRR